MITAQVSPSIHEATITKFATEGEDDPALQALHAAVKQLRTACERATVVTDALLGNLMITEPARHQQARDRGFTLVEPAWQAIDAAVKSLQAEDAKLAAKLHGPPPAKDLLQQAERRERRDALRSIRDKAERRAIIDAAIAQGDVNDITVSAVLEADPWLLGLDGSELAMARAHWQRRHHAAAMSRLERHGKAVEAASRAGLLSQSFLASLTNADLIAQAVDSAARAEAAMQRKVDNG